MIQMCMMYGPPKDVRMTPAYSLVESAKEATLTILVKDKDGRSVLDAMVLVMIECGPPMSTMEMVGPMIPVEEIDNGKYLVRFTPDKNGIYTLQSCNTAGQLCGDNDEQHGHWRDCKVSW